MVSKKIKSQIDKGKFKFQEKFEDIHLNIEKRLFELIGHSAGSLHTARSRNDQALQISNYGLKNRQTKQLII